MDNKCKATTKKGSRCTRKSKADGLCNQHNPKFKNKPKKPHQTLELPRLPENLSEKLANSSDVGIRKIKEQIIKMWLEDGGSYLTLDKYNNRIPVSIPVYDELIKRFNGEEIIVDQIFVTEVLPKSESKVYGSNNPPMVPISVAMYSAFIPKKGIFILSKPQQKALKKIQDFITSEWIKMGEKIYNGKVYLNEKIYNGAKNFLKNKFKEVNDNVYLIDLEHWLEYFMKTVFEIGPEPPVKPDESKSYSKPKSKINTAIFHNIPPPTLKKFNSKNYREELVKHFPDKDIDLYINVISCNSGEYPIKSKLEIHKLYLEFHPDKCITNPKVAKLCNVFCAKVENIKKIWDHRKNPSVSPAKVRGNDIDSVFKILNDEV